MRSGEGGVLGSPNGPACSVASRPSRLRRCLPRKAGSLDPTCARCWGHGALDTGALYHGADS
jgi:hypothetical protein